tara:strand:- start:2553 stop:2825 length:273 start_codon:yes stop_codon:yes gene_type:complete
MTNYTVTLKKPMSSIQKGHEWSEALPDKWFETKKYHFDGHEFGPIGGKSDFTLFWYPKTYKNAIELLYDMKKKKRINSMKNTVFSIMIYD